MPARAAAQQSLARCVLLLTPLLSHALPFHTFAESGDEPAESPSTPIYWIKLGVCVALVLLGGVFAGLTIALMGLDQVNLQVLSVSGTEAEQVQSAKVLKLLDKGRHWVLVVLLMSNVVVNESLPIFLDSILGQGIAAVFISTGAIVIFGEVIPQSICVRYGLAIGAASAPLVLALMYLEFPIAYPVAMLLDKALGHDEGTVYKKAELKTFVSLHQHLGNENLDHDEVTIISSVLELSEKSVESIMTPIKDVYTLSSDQILDQATVDNISKEGYSRVPIYSNERDNFIGMLLIKKLISYDPEDAKPVSDFQLSVLPECDTSMTCLQALNFFQEGRSHILLVSTDPGEAKGAIGVVTLEDVLEEVIGEEIIDETDVFVDVERKLRVVRRPQLGARGGTRNGITPLLKGVIERRKAGSPAPMESPPAAEAAHKDYGAIGKGSAAVTSTKVKLKGGGAPQKKSALLLHPPTQEETSNANQSGVAEGQLVVDLPSGPQTPSVEGTEDEPLLRKIHRKNAKK